MPFPTTWSAFLVVWAVVAIPGMMLLMAFGPEWAVILGAAVALAALAGGITTLNDLKRPESS